MTPDQAADRCAARNATIRDILPGAGARLSVRGACGGGIGARSFDLGKSV